MNFVNSNVQIGYNNTMNFHSYRSMNSDLSSESEDEDCAEDKEWTDMVDKLKRKPEIVSGLGFCNFAIVNIVQKKNLSDFFGHPKLNN